MAEYKFEFPLKDHSQLRKLKVGDLVTINGVIIGLRDATLIRMIDNEIEPPLDLTGAVCLHTAPIARKVNGRYEPVCVGPTTSIRMNRFTAPLLNKYKISAIIGKAGLLSDSVKAMQEFGGCYFSAVGGAAALGALQIDEIEEVFWEDLMPECLWKFRVSNYGPLIVSIDSHGNSLYEEVRGNAASRLKESVKKIIEA